MNYTITTIQSPVDAYSNCVYLKTKVSDYVNIHINKKSYIFKVIEKNNLNDFMPYICMNSLQRTFLGVKVNDTVNITPIQNISNENVIFLDKLNINLAEDEKYINESSIKKVLLNIPVYKNMVYVFTDSKINFRILSDLEDDTCYMIHENTNIVFGDVKPNFKIIYDISHNS